MLQFILIYLSRFWKCTLSSMDSQLFTISRQGAPLHVSLSTKSFEFGIEEEDGVKKPRRKSSVTETLQDTNYHWEEWKPVYQEEKSTKINIPGKKKGEIIKNKQNFIKNRSRQNS